MKKFKFLLLFACIVSLTSCYTYTFDVGNGANTGVETTQKNHYLIAGLVPLSEVDHEKLAKGASDYTVKIEHSFVDGLLNVITFGIYTPTTTTITR
jgi:hypothetical protein